MREEGDEIKLAIMALTASLLREKGRLIAADAIDKSITSLRSGGESDNA